MGGLNEKMCKTLLGVDDTDKPLAKRIDKQTDDKK